MLILAGHWSVDSAHSSVDFQVRRLMMSKVRGSFGAFNGSVSFGENFADFSLEAEADTASVTTGQKDRDAHLFPSTFSTWKISPKPPL